MLSSWIQDNLWFYSRMLSQPQFMSSCSRMSQSQQGEILIKRIFRLSLLEVLKLRSFQRMRNLEVLTRFCLHQVGKCRENNLDMINLKFSHKLKVLTGAFSLLRMILLNKLLKPTQPKDKDQLTN